MTSVICRFEDESDFLKQRDLAARAGTDTGFVLFGEFDLETGERASLTVLVNSARERTTLGFEVIERTPVARDGMETAETSGQIYRYVVDVTDGDEVWLDMLDQKMAMRRELTAA